MRLSDALAVWLAESVALTVILLVTAADGVPEMIPPVLRLSPAGNVPAVNAKVYAPVPPAVASVELYVLPTVPAGNDVVVIVKLPLLIAILNDALAIWFAESVADTPTVVVPAAVGVPETRPVELLRLSPAGRVPEAQVTDPVAPDAANVVPYAEPTVPPGNDVVVMDKPLLIVMLNEVLAAWLTESITVTATFVVPTAVVVGVPPMRPVAGLIFKPAGRVAALQL